MTNSSLRPLVDADYIAYRIGFAIGDSEPIEFALSTVKNHLNHIHDKFSDRPEPAKLFFGGKNNFREKIATLNVYKGNRDPSKKPYYYDDIREYMINYHGAVVVDGMEAEDACGIEQFANKDKSTVIVGVDKDLLCIPGYHYNPVKDTLIYQNIGNANQHFWTQVLTGDPTDNIKGLDKVGPKTAEKILAPCNQQWIAMHDAVLNEYDKKFGTKGYTIMNETAKLVWILREEGKTYDGSSI